ncbi:hypothetical protein AUC69_10915 [Methyloceanibacter superfactus]|jgi:hypothetical protein|uniref:DUF4189 domain-containing protein n=1 Tax=Methyloceanibacter superfactus TaxID=1774969 RepID=A0A1E3VXH4_9HYPH|nr:hypothetical protein [Methyloceanibacter superfactus]ODR97616.1 hypothetical protein AUC69_10915 [Methyloceanibacter superfactus]
MKKLWVVALALCATLAFSTMSDSVYANGSNEDCFVVTGSANARNQWVSQRRAAKRLADQIAVHMGDPAGVTVGPTRYNCILEACEASALVCHRR